MTGNPLVKKLGIKEGARLFLIAAPKNYSALIAPLPPDVRFMTRPTKAVDLAHVFATRRILLASALERLRKSLDVHASIWVSWPKQAAKVPTDITDQTIREVALPLGFVDIKVCAVDEVWSGLKLVVRKELRPKQT